MILEGYAALFGELDLGGDIVRKGAFAASLARRGEPRLTINRRADLRTGWRVLWGARVLRVVGVRDDGAARQTLDCQEDNS
jgi:head-tail adaptor